MLPAQQALQADSQRGRKPKAVVPLSYLFLEDRGAAKQEPCSCRALWKCVTVLELHSHLISVPSAIRFEEDIPSTCRGWYLNWLCRWRWFWSIPDAPLSHHPLWPWDFVAIRAAEEVLLKAVEDAPAAYGQWGMVTRLFWFVGQGYLSHKGSPDGKCVCVYLHACT